MINTFLFFISSLFIYFLFYFFIRKRISNSIFVQLIYGLFVGIYANVASNGKFVEYFNLIYSDGILMVSLFMILLYLLTVLFS